MSGSGWVRTPSGAELRFDGEVVRKRHHARTDARDLAARLALAVDAALAPWLVAPLSPEPAQEDDGRLVTTWPRIDVLDPRDDPPWAEAGRLLAGLHRVRPGRRVPALDPASRVERALSRLDDAALASDSNDLVREAGARALAEIRNRPVPRPALCHGDWHLGQLGRAQQGWRLLDVDDLGWGDPAWDLARPAGFWAAGLLPDDDWGALLAAYQGANGPAVPAHGDPWPRLELPARAAVVVAACRAHPDHEVTRALVEACTRMPG